MEWPILPRQTGFFREIAKKTSVKEILNLFVYGSLKLGECNDRMVKSWVRKSVPATTRGFMHLRPDRYPALFLPVHGSLGSADYKADLNFEASTHFQKGLQGDQGYEISGQLLELVSGVELLARLDDFEGYFPGARSEYLRVAILVETAEGPRSCWTYTGVKEPPKDWPVITQWPPEEGFARPEPFSYEL